MSLAYMSILIQHDLRVLFSQQRRLESRFHESIKASQALPASSTKCALVFVGTLTTKTTTNTTTVQCG